MKKVLCATMLVLVSDLLFSQAKFEFGLKAGANFANTDLDNSESITTFHGGVYALVKIAKIGIQPEALWSRQGNKFSSSGGDNKIDLTYINIPFMLKFYLPLGLNLQAGPQFGILTNAESNGSDITDNLKSSDLSAVLGAGWDAPFGLQISARYILGLSDINDSFVKESFKNKIFQLSIGYSLFKLGK